MASADTAPGWTKKDPTLSPGYIKMSGKYRLAAGANSEDFIVNDSNADMQERNFRYVFGERLNNTYDPAIYDRYELNVDFSPKPRWSMHTQLVADPWSWVGTTGEQVQRSDIGGEVMRYNLKYWGANNSVLNEIHRTNVADSYAFPIIEVKDGHTVPTVVRGFYDFNPGTNGIPFTIPELDIDYEFRPVRDFWVDYNRDKWHARLFLLASEAQALSTDDPLELSNHKDYWQQSPWLYQYKPLQYFTDGSIKRGYYSDNLSFLARDSEGNRLIRLRGASVEADMGSTYFAATVAAPYSPWDEKFLATDNVPAAARLKHQVNDKLMLGSTFTFRSGLIDNSIADFNQVAGFDAKYRLGQSSHIVGEIAGSHRERDLLTNERIKTDSEGYAYKVAYESGFDHTSGHRDLHLSYTQMDEAFEPNLSRYSNTRDDHFWGKHISFDEISPELEHFRIGDGVDTNRVAFRAQWKEKLFQEKFVNLFDARSVRRTSNWGYKETVIRDEITYQVNEKLKTKGLFRWHGLPKTTPYVEPFLSNFYFPSDTVDLSALTLQNVAVPADRDASRFTTSGGLQYIFDSRWTAEGVYERSNDLSDFPRGLLNNTFRDANDRVDGLLIDHVTTFLYGQSALGAVPPYRYHNLWKERVIYKPEENLSFIFHAAQNGYKFAGGIDDNINHQGLSVSYAYSDRLSFFFDYTHSRQIDLPRLVATGYAQEVYDEHHNVYMSMDYRLNSSAIFRAEYGVFGMGSNTPQVNSYSTTSFSLPTIDTEHLFRVSLTGDF